jgi:RNA polymerase sigma-70 factor (ECF subfamily)
MLRDPQLPGEAKRIASETDADLVARTLAGERAAFGVLVDRYAASVRRVARAVLGDQDDADDAAQDGLLAALVKLRKYDSRRPFGPWLMRVVANVVAPGRAPDAETERRALGGRLREALARLPQRRRLAVVLFDVEGYSHAEIGHILGIPEGTVRSEVFHARRALRELLVEWREDE